MPECNRCTKRITTNTDDNNHGYCESCLVLVARELIANTPDFDYTEQNSTWRTHATQTLIDLYMQLKDAGMEQPLQGMSSSMRILFWRLVSTEEYKRIKDYYNETD